MNQNTKGALILGAVLATPLLLLGMASVALESPPDQVAAPAQAPIAQAAPARVIVDPFKPQRAIIDPFKSAPAAQPQFSQEELDRVNAALQARNDAIEIAEVAGRAAGQAYAEEQRRR